MKKLCLIINDLSWDDHEYLRAFKNINRQFAAHFNITVILLHSDTRALPFPVNLHINSEQKLPEFKVYIVATDTNIDFNFFQPDDSTVFLVNKKGVIKNQSGKLDSVNYPYLNTHIFNRLCSKNSEEFIYAPFGVSAIYPNMGEIDAFGNRIPYDYTSKINRPLNEKIIVILGGSAAYGLDCHFEDTFGFLLQEKLNQFCEAQKKDFFFSVLNFSQNGQIVLEQTTRYTLFCHLLKPDLVISHDGWNDLAMGIVGDPYLINQHEIIYRLNFEDWAQKLHATESEQKTQSGDVWTVKNLPDKVIKAYIDRKLMLKTIVEANSGKLIWGFQGALFSKKEPSKEEIKYRDDINSRNYNAMAHVFDKKLPFVFDQASKKMKTCLNFKIIDFHHYFKKFGEEKSIFFDRVHTQPDGEKEIAKIYFENILEDYLLNDNI